MKKDLCEIIAIIDESGSMGSVSTDTIGGFNTFIQTHQNLPGEAKLTLVKFDTKYEIVHNGLDIQKVPFLTDKTYIPSGMTGLYDAIGKAIDEVGKRLANTPEDERPEKVICLIITDGEENSSKEYTQEMIKEKTTHQKDIYNWEFIFLGADQDAWSNAQSMGISNSRGFTQLDMGQTIKSSTLYSANYRSKNTVNLADFDLSDKETDEQLKDLTSQSKK